jgi:hypothetical protein
MEQIQVEGTKQGRQVQLPCQPACFLCPLLVLALKWIFAAATNWTKQGRQALCAIIPSISYDVNVIKMNLWPLHIAKIKCTSKLHREIGRANIP